MTAVRLIMILSYGVSGLCVALYAIYKAYKYLKKKQGDKN